MRWTNQDLRLYHGTVDVHVQSVLGGIDLNHPAMRRAHDFGPGFYTTSWLRQAQKWAATLPKRRFPGTHPAVVYFTIPRDVMSRLECGWFVRGTESDEDYWALIEHFRGRPIGRNHCRTEGSTWYDVVAGPVAGDWLNRKSIQGTDQVSFHSPRAIQILNALQDKGVML